MFGASVFVATNSLAQYNNILAKSWLIADQSGKIQVGSNFSEQRSIASITKLMTVIVVLDQNQDLEQKIGKYTRAELIKLSLIKSDNAASDTLCNNMPGGKSFCVYKMNEKAALLGMHNTKFVEPTGLSPMNISTAEDLVKLTVEASKYQEITSASQTAKTTIVQNKRNIIVENTNKLIGKGNEFLVSKTGTTNAAGQCIVMMDSGGKIFVLLGMKPGRRVLESKEIMSL